MFNDCSFPHDPSRARLAAQHLASIFLAERAAPLLTLAVSTLKLRSFASWVATASLRQFPCWTDVHKIAQIWTACTKQEESHGVTRGAVRLSFPHLPGAVPSPRPCWQLQQLEKRSLSLSCWMPGLLRGRVGSCCCTLHGKLDELSYNYNVSICQLEPQGRTYQYVAHTNNTYIYITEFRYI